MTVLKTYGNCYGTYAKPKKRKAGINIHFTVLNMGNVTKSDGLFLVIHSFIHFYLFIIYLSINSFIHTLISFDYYADSQCGVRSLSMTSDLLINITGFDTLTN